MAASTLHLSVAVTDPARQGDSYSNSFVLYTVTTTCEAVDEGGCWTAGTFVARRRYRDFAWLHGHLAKTVAGSILPPLPHSRGSHASGSLHSTVLRDRFEATFVEERRSRLDRYIHALAQHPEVRHLQDFQIFLCADESTLANFKSQRLGGDPMAEALASRFASMKHWVGSSAVVSTSLGANNKSTLDLKLDEVAAHVLLLEERLTLVLDKVSSLLKCNKEVAVGVFDTGLAFSLLGQMEGRGVYGETLKSLGHTADHISVMMAEQREHDLLQFKEELSENLGLIGSVKLALQQRDKIKAHHGSAQIDFDSKAAALEHMRETDEPKLQKLEAASQASDDAAESLKQATAALDEVTARLIREIDRFKRSKAAAIHQLMRDFAVFNLEFARKLEAQWGHLGPKMEYTLSLLDGREVHDAGV
uniref:PX domain-containing protein n=1 Tax=Rhizochromulina marina TaxID=1034831 RepID=A0A7S2SQH6_9STRA|mmetsp:Transcript_4280/g.12703  ORF Transcript_4280/g.12703 Transcript_4280/m.12703 type:complete len:419 (+) Transcript_4280:249-1505(+)